MMGSSLRPGRRLPEDPAFKKHRRAARERLARRCPDNLNQLVSSRFLFGKLGGDGGHMCALKPGGLQFVFRGSPLSLSPCNR